MAKKKQEAKAEPQEEMEEVLLDEEKKDPDDDGLKEVPSSEIEVEETESEEEEVEEEEGSPRTDPTEAILSGFNMLREELKNRGEAAPALPAKEQGESDEDFSKRVNEELFKDNPAGIIDKAIDRRARKIVETEIAPVLGSIMEDAFNNAEFRLKNDEKDGPIFRKFEGEIRTMLKTLSPSQQKNPQILKAVFERVKTLHVDEVVDMEVERRGKKAGSSPASSAPARKAPIGEGGSSVMPGSSSGRRVMIPRSEMEELRKRANQMGVDVSVLVERRVSKR